MLVIKLLTIIEYLMKYISHASLKGLKKAREKKIVLSFI